MSGRSWECWQMTGWTIFLRPFFKLLALCCRSILVFTFNMRRQLPINDINVFMPTNFLENYLFIIGSQSVLELKSQHNGIGKRRWKIDSLELSPGEVMNIRKRFNIILINNTSLLHQSNHIQSQPTIIHSWVSPKVRRSSLHANGRVSICWVERLCRSSFDWNGTETSRDFCSSHL